MVFFKIEAQNVLRIAYICPRNTVRGIHLFNFDLTHLSIYPNITTEVENRLGTPGGHGNRFIENSKNHD